MDDGKSNYKSLRITETLPDGTTRTGTAERYGAGWHVVFDEEPTLLYNYTDSEVKARRTNPAF